MYVLGIDIGTGATRAAVSRLDGTWGEPRRVGLEQVAVLPAPVAAVEGYPDGDTVAVFSLGATDCECALVGRTGAGGFDLIACAEPTEPVGGADFDDALMEWVQEQVSGPV